MSCDPHLEENNIASKTWFRRLPNGTRTDLGNERMGQATLAHDQVYYYLKVTRPIKFSSLFL